MEAVCLSSGEALPPCDSVVESSSAQCNLVKAILSMVSCSHLDELLLTDPRGSNKRGHLLGRHGVAATVLEGLARALVLGHARSGGLAGGANATRGAVSRGRLLGAGLVEASHAWALGVGQDRRGHLHWLLQRLSRNVGGDLAGQEGLRRRE